MELNGIAKEFFLLCELEPRLKFLAADLFLVCDDKKKPSFCANNLWCTKFKLRLSLLVGWNAGLIHADEMPPGPHDFAEIHDFFEKHPPVFAPVDPRLKTEEAYDVAYRFLYEFLPPCRNCSCVPINCGL